MLQSTQKTVNWTFHWIALQKEFEKAKRHKTGVVPAPLFAHLVLNFVVVVCFFFFCCLLRFVIVVCLFFFFSLRFLLFPQKSFSYMECMHGYFVFFPLRIFQFYYYCFFFNDNFVLLCFCLVVCFVVYLFQSPLASSPLYENK